jgi:large subunit ribosomal protein L4
MRRLALRSVLSSKVTDERLLVLDALEISTARTKEISALLTTLGVEGKAMIVLPMMNETVRRAAKNVPGLLTVTPSTMNLQDLLSRDRVVMTVGAVDAVTQWLGGSN